MCEGNRSSRALAWSLAVLLGTVSLVGAGCGGSDDDSSASASNAIEASPKSKYAAASEPPDTFVNRVANLLKTTRSKAECASLEQINEKSVARFTCPPPAELRKSMAAFKLRDSATYGTGGVVDYTSGELKKGGSMLLFVGIDRAWGISRAGVIAGKTVGTSDKDSREAYDKAVLGYLAAVRDRDCNAYYRYVFRNSKSRKEICKEDFPGTALLGKQLSADPKAKPLYEGGNGIFGFYTVATRKPKPDRVTISVAKSGSDQPVVVMNVVPTATRAQQRDVQEAFERQRKQKKQQDQPPTSKSRKAD